MDNRRKFSSNNDKDREDVPVYSRLFIVCDRDLKDEHFRESFSQFGTIEDIRIPCDHNTGKPKGVVFIKYSKTSEAAKALEAMNSKVLKNSSRPLKVMVAANRSDIQSDNYSNDKYRRLFLHIPKDMEEDVLEEHFKNFGYIEDVLIQRDRNTKESKGFAYIKYRKFSEAALAYEECERKFRAIFAQPKGHNKRQETTFETNINNLASSTANQNTSLISAMNVSPRGFTRVNFMCSPYLTQMHIETLFDIIPGMVDCRYFVDLIKNYGKGSAQFSNPVSAAYAVEKLNEFEYPPGQRIFVRPANTQFDAHEKNFTDIPNAVHNLRNAIESTSKSSSPDLAQLAQAIAEASKLIKIATTGVSSDSIPDSNDLNYCSVQLPPTQPLADIDSTVAKRCFLVCKPQPPPLTVLRDIFCRFGSLINVYTLPNKTVGYARYATTEAADEAIRVLHGAEICGVRIKVLEAEAEAPAKRKRYD
ncbi:RNA-binding protein 45-like [Pararge aegeria]|uniref:Jg20591 protein n=4 Tax=Pararge aegeria TaxID=116150 RepID=A0A8S4RQF2_9NEOP|nr:RNA-binding protein 45-like [Pararge aegeria]CAH2239656.1 jg20591 [Pararge aegeria aegeria]